MGSLGSYVYNRYSLSGFKPRRKWLFSSNVRHSTAFKRENDLVVFFSRVGDCPERIMCSRVDFSSGHWDKWQASEPIEVMRPVEKWEGAGKKHLPSRRGQAAFTVNQLRDPFVFEDPENGLYLVYTAGGEQSIGLVKLIVN